MPGELPAPYGEYEQSLLNWIAAAEQEGEAILKAEPAYEQMDKGIAYIMGEQLDPDRPNALSAIIDNRIKHIVLQTVAALTDIHPLFGFKTYNDTFQQQADTLVRLSQSWWTNTFADLQLADVIRFAATLGTGYCEVRWDPSLAGGDGDVSLVPRDPRDVIPIRPTMNRSIQTWEGIMVRSASTVNQLRAEYPEKAYRIVPDRAPTLLSRSWTRAKRLMSRIVSPAPIDVLTNSPSHDVPLRVPACDVLTIYIKDRTLNTTDQPILMGKPGTSWCYTVYPIGVPMPDGRKATDEDARLYPRGRMIIATRTVVLYDGPNPYWHGMFPVAKLQLDPWPWALLGAGLAHDLIPLQDTVNNLINGILDHAHKTLRPAIVADKKSVPEGLWQKIDTRLPGLKIKSNPAVGKGVEFVEQQNLNPYVMEVLQLVIQEMDNLSGVANLSALTQLNQAPGADSIEKMMEALTPLLRLKGRLLEAFLREIGEMVKGDFFQFYTMPRRIAMLGEAGLNFSDFDFDPGTLVPSLTPEDPGYVPQLDRLKSRAERGQWHTRNFTFQITPNSLLAISQLSRKLLYLQLWRGGLMDPWTLFEVLEIPNGGTPPGGTAETIIDRLQLAQQLGLVPVAGEGRPPTAQQAPSMQVKQGAGGPRTTVSESGAGGPH